MIKITIPLKPITKKNNQRIVTRRDKRTHKEIPLIIPSETYVKYEKEALKYIKTAYDGEPINYRVAVKCLFYRPNRIRCDLTNLLEAIDDVLVKANVLSDDNFNIIASHDGSRVLIDKDFTRTEVYIEEYYEEENDKNYEEYYEEGDNEDV